MKFDFNFQIKDLDGNDIPDESNHAGKLIASALTVGEISHNPVFYDWAVKLWKLEPIELSDADYELFLPVIRRTDKINNLGKTPIIRYMESVKK